MPRLIFGEIRKRLSVGRGVRENPVIFNTADPQHKNRRKIDRIFEKIADDINLESGALPGPDFVTGAEAKKIWKGMRTRYNCVQLELMRRPRYDFQMFHNYTLWILRDLNFLRYHTHHSNGYRNKDYSRRARREIVRRANQAY
ncbi:hypothetical protein QAD02_000668 [Eretmocerus hayati]|uniref:Uncharacterized protein n=1 Tax=Eretmocerus hayati TaxID=131215 RepID=A0ACC2NGC8_9HYME|nr:hypothetical protein QAD02_000668 [Eretmocerus hayati]